MSRLCSCGRPVTRGRNAKRCERCFNLEELHGRWDKDREGVLPAGKPEAKRVPHTVKTGRLEALLWCSMVFQQCQSREEFEGRVRREIEALEDDEL